MPASVQWSNHPLTDLQLLRVVATIADTEAVPGTYLCRIRNESGVTHSIYLIPMDQYRITQSSLSY